MCLRRFWHPMLEQVVEWLGDTGASRHVCNDLSLMWDVRTREKPILLRQLVGTLHVYTTGTVKLECPNLFGGTVVVNMLETCYIPEAKVNLFSLQKLRKALYVTEQQDQLGTQWARNPQGEFFMRKREDSEGRAVIDCHTILPDAATFSAKVVEVIVGSVVVAGGNQGVEGADVKQEEAFAALDVKLLHRRVGHIGKGGRLSREGLVRGLDGGVVGEMDVCQGCELVRPCPHPHRPVDPEFRATRPLELVHADLAGPIRVKSWGGANSTSR